ncbi:MAG: chromosomal replication initiator protein DnaA [Phycisphaerae bacterium]|nr:chromosomal replication initiator protein DnaA [Phycisphaerae bacterium]
MPRPEPEIRVSINDYLRRHHPELWRHWFDDIEPIDIQSGVLRLVVREPIQLRFLQKSCTAYFTEAAQAATGRLLAVRFVGPHEVEDLGDSLAPPAAVSVAAPRTATKSRAGQEVVAAREPAAMASAATRGNADLGAGVGLAMGAGSGPAIGLPSAVPADASRDVPFELDEQMLLSPDYTFENFVVGPGNRLALAAALAVGEKPGRSYNPYFVHGGVGLGKTHLLQAICQTILRRNPKAKIAYISCNTFMDLFHEAVRGNTMAEFRSRFRTCDLLVIDDIHFLSKRDQTQEEFFHTFNALYQAGRQIVLSSDAAPSDIPDLEERLTSRFSCGLVARIDRPCYETRVSIVKSKARIHELDLPDDVPAYIAAKIDSNIRELEGALTKIRGFAMATGAPITLDLAKQALADSSTASASGQPTVQMIIEEVSRFFDVKLTDLLSKRRHKSIALPRQVCMWLARKHTRFSLEEIGGYFGGRDHTTVMHAIRTINSKRGGDAKLSADVSRVEEQLLQRVR